jgi:protein tyrosine/serine phosphatase
MINLKGVEKKPWYLDEIKAAEDMGIVHVDIGLNPWRLPPPKELVKLLDAFKTEPYPIWIHCQAGSDRTGLACVLYRVVQEHASLDEAIKDQLTWRYGHWAYGNARAMDTFFELYRQTGKTRDLVRWIMDDYPAIYAERK